MITQEQYEAGPYPSMSVLELLDGASYALSEIRGDWTNPKSDIRMGQQFLTAAYNRLAGEE